MKKIVVLVGICGLFLIFGVLAAVTTVVETNSGLASRDWPTTEGEILRAQRHKGSQGARKVKRFEYRYTVDGNVYTSTRAAFVRVPYIDPLHRKYHSGMAVRVHYDAADPGRSVVEPGAPVIGVLAESLVSLILIGLGGAGLFYGLGRRDRRDR